MISKKKQLAFAKKMFEESLNEKGQLEPKKFNKILKEINNLKPTGFINILKTYKRLIETKIAKEEIIVEVPEKLSNQKKFEDEILKKTGGQTVQVRINPKIVFGAKITHGDWIYDSTLSAKLKQLT